MNLDPFAPMARVLMVLGILLFIFGGVFWLLGRVNLPGGLPGDFVVRRGNFRLYFPLMTSILLSLFLTLILNLVLRR